jgi:adenylate cyclase class 2
MGRSGGSREVEIKLTVAGAVAGRRLLRGAGFRVVEPRIFEDNLVFDTPGRSLRGAGELLRLRVLGRKGTLTYKSPGVPGKHKDREEIEIKNIDPRTALALLTRLRFELAFRYQKYRTEFQRPGAAGVATLDETPVGVFLELEGRPAWIDRTARQLGYLEADYVRASYAQLYHDWARRHKVQPEHMVFPGRAGSRLVRP